MHADEWFGMLQSVSNTQVHRVQRSLARPPYGYMMLGKQNDITYHMTYMPYDLTYHMNYIPYDLTCRHTT